MPLRRFALVMVVPLAIAAGTVLPPGAREPCRTGPFAPDTVCASLDYSGLVFQGLARRVQSSALREGDALMYALTSSPLIGVDFGALRRVSLWWVEQTGAAAMARHGIR